MIEFVSYLLALVAFGLWTIVVADTFFGDFIRRKWEAMAAFTGCYSAILLMVGLGVLHMAAVVLSVLGLCGVFALLRLQKADRLITRQDVMIMATLSLVFFGVAVWNLGMRDVPVTACQVSGSESFYVDLGHPENVESLYVLFKKADPVVNFKVCTGSPSHWTREINASVKDYRYYRWERISINRETQYLRFVFEDHPCEIAEIAVVGKEGRIIPATLVTPENGGSGDLYNLIDEQEKVEKIEFPPTYMAQTYFDEIYYVRNAEEYLSLQEPSERTHPPFGTFLIATGILTFGYSPFGWRIAGVVFATLMIPLMYIFGKRMFGTRVAGFASSFLWTFGFMNFTMGRMATVDTFAVFFSILSNLFFFIYFQGIIQKKKASTSALFLAVLFFALGFSVKWYVLYGFIGQIFLLGVLRLRKVSAFRGGWTRRIRDFILYPLSKLAPFLVIAAVIYLLMFVPFMIIGHSLGDVFVKQFEMFGFHAGLTATHPFSSPWWSWPFIIKPVWLDVSYLPGNQVSTIASMGNPAIWWVGTILLIFPAIKIIKKREFTSLFIVTIFLFQWLPYAFITRCVFLYHFYASVPLLVLAITYFLNELWKKRLGKPIVLVYLAIVVALFMVFYPVISGYPISSTSKEGLRWLGSWTF